MLRVKCEGKFWRKRCDGCGEASFYENTGTACSLASLRHRTIVAMLGGDELLVAVTCERHFTHLQLVTIFQIFLRYRDMQRWETGGAAVMTHFKPSFWHRVARRVLELCPTVDIDVNGRTLQTVVDYVLAKWAGQIPDGRVDTSTIPYMLHLQLMYHHKESNPCGYRRCLCQG